MVFYKGGPQPPRKKREPPNAESADAAEFDAITKSPRRKSHRTVLKLLTRDELDGRTKAYQTFERTVSAVTADLGGESELSTIEKSLIEALAGGYVLLDNLNAHIISGNEIDLSAYSQVVNAIVKISGRVGLKRRAKDVLDLQSYLAHKERERADAEDDADED